MSKFGKEVAKDYKGLFKGYCFNFEGLKESLKKGFVDLVKDLGADVSNDAPYTFVKQSYFEKKENNMKDNFYDIKSIMKAVEDKDPSKLSKFIPTRVPNDGPMCCRKDKSRLISEESELSSANSEEIIEYKKSLKKSIISSESEDYCDKKKSRRKKVKYSNDEVDLSAHEPEHEPVNMPTHIDDLNSSQANDNSNTVNNEKLIKKTIPDKIHVEKDIEDDYFKKSKWWLSYDIPEENKCSIESCTYEPEPHPVHYNPRYVYSMVEKKIIVKYLINKAAIDQCKGITVYREMIKDGYVAHRDDYSLKNVFRHTIEKELGNYNLDTTILNKFSSVKEKINLEKKKNLKLV